jgi:hypothetical protein
VQSIFVKSSLDATIQANDKKSTWGVRLRKKSRYGSLAARSHLGNDVEGSWDFEFMLMLGVDKK